MAIKIAKPSDAEARKYPREFAIYTQIPGALSGSMISEVRFCAEDASICTALSKGQEHHPEQGRGRMCIDRHLSNMHRSQFPVIRYAAITVTYGRPALYDGLCFLCAGPH